MKRKLYILLGGGSGLGKKLVDNLCKNNTVYALINKSRIKERKNLFTFKLDLSNKKSIDTFFLKNSKKIKKFDKIVFLSIATTKEDRLLINMSYKMIERVFKINVISNYYFCSKLMSLATNKKVKIIFFSSSRALYGDAGISLYSGSKHALVGLMQSLICENKNINFTCNIISLGFFDTDLWKSLPKKIKDKLLSLTAYKKIGKFKEILNSVKYIDNNDYLNGCILKLDGGYGIVPHR